MRISSALGLWCGDSCRFFFIDFLIECIQQQNKPSWGEKNTAGLFLPAQSGWLFFQASYHRWHGYEFFLFVFFMMLLKYLSAVCVYMYVCVCVFCFNYKCASVVLINNWTFAAKAARSCSHKNTTSSLLSAVSLCNRAGLYRTQIVPHKAEDVNSLLHVTSNNHQHRLCLSWRGVL